MFFVVSTKIFVCWSVVRSAWSVVCENDAQLTTDNGQLTNHIFRRWNVNSWRISLLAGAVAAAGPAPR